MIFVDSNVLIDVFAADQMWRPWSRRMLMDLAVDGEDLVVSTVVLAELAGNAPDLDALLAALASFDIEILVLDPHSAFRAGEAFRRYRNERKTQPQGHAILADFLIGAQALEYDTRLLTRDPSLYRRYFPPLTLITPETHP